MRILFDPAAHDMRNKGNNALLQVAMQRMKKLWPEASLEVITFAPNLLRMYYPYAFPVNPDNLQRVRGRFDKYGRLVPPFFWWTLFEAREELWHRRYAKAISQSPSPLGHTAVGDHTRETNSNGSAQGSLISSISEFDLYIGSGGGYMCDSDKRMLLDVFDRLEAAIYQGVPTALVGQGIGPMKDAELLARARTILPSVDLIFFRNRPNGLPLLQSVNVSSERIFLTGDDAVELAYENRSPSLGNGIGVSLRVAHYTGIEKEHIDTVRNVLHEIARRHRAELVAIPISSAHHESDITHIKQVLEGYDRVSIGWRKLDTPVDAIHKVKKCRLVITGTYHGAIFALAQGIPVVGVARSTEYFDKLSELCDEFPAGIRVLRLNNEQLADRLAAAIEDAWQKAEEVRPALLNSALRQIESQNSAYRRIYELINLKGNNEQGHNNGQK